MFPEMASLISPKMKNMSENIYLALDMICALMVVNMALSMEVNTFMTKVTVKVGQTDPLAKHIAVHEKSNEHTV